MKGGRVPAVIDDNFHQILQALRSYEKRPLRAGSEGYDNRRVV